MKRRAQGPRLDALLTEERLEAMHRLGQKHDEMCIAQLLAAAGEASDRELEEAVKNAYEPETSNEDR